MSSLFPYGSSLSDSVQERARRRGAELQSVMDREQARRRELLASREAIVASLDSTRLDSRSTSFLRSRSAGVGGAGSSSDLPNTSVPSDMSASESMESLIRAQRERLMRVVSNRVSHAPPLRPSLIDLAARDGHPQRSASSQSPEPAPAAPTQPPASAGVHSGLGHMRTDVSSSEFLQQQQQQQQQSLGALGSSLGSGLGSHRSSWRTAGVAGVRREAPGGASPAASAPYPRPAGLGPDAGGSPTPLSLDPTRSRSAVRTGASGLPLRVVELGGSASSRPFGSSAYTTVAGGGLSESTDQQPKLLGGPAATLKGLDLDVSKELADAADLRQRRLADIKARLRSSSASLTGSTFTTGSGFGTHVVAGTHRSDYHSQATPSSRGATSPRMSELLAALREPESQSVLPDVHLQSPPPLSAPSVDTDDVVIYNEVASAAESASPRDASPYRGGSRDSFPQYKSSAASLSISDRAAFESKMAAVSAKEIELNEALAKCAKNSAALNARDQQLSSREEDLARRLADCAIREKHCTQKEEELRGLRKEADAIAEANLRTIESLAEREAKLNATSMGISRQIEDVQRREAILEERNVEIAEQLRDLQMRETTVAEKEATINDRGGHLLDGAHQLAERADAIAVAERDIESIRHHQAERAKALCEAEAEFEALREQEIAKLQATARSENAHISPDKQTDGESKVLREKVAGYELEVQNLHELLAAMQKALQDTSMKLVDAEQQVQLYQNAKSLEESVPDIESTTSGASSVDLSHLKLDEEVPQPAICGYSALRIRGVWYPLHYLPGGQAFYLNSKGRRTFLTADKFNLFHLRGGLQERVRVIDTLPSDKVADTVTSAPGPDLYFSDSDDDVVSSSEVSDDSDPPEVLSSGYCGVQVDGSWYPLVTVPGGAVFYLKEGEAIELTAAVFMEKMASQELLAKVSTKTEDMRIYELLDPSPAES